MQYPLAVVLLLLAASPPTSVSAPTVSAPTSTVARSRGSVSQQNAAPMVFEKLNRGFSNVAENLEPIDVGAARVLLRSPKHELVLLENRVSLVVDPLGGHRIALQLVISGWGEIEADVVMGSIQTTVSDRLALPVQTLELIGRAEIVPDPGGYRIIVLDLPDSVTVTIESALAQKLLRICRPMVLVLVGLDCAALESSLTRVVVPLPDAGTSYLLPFEELTGEDRSALDRYLGGGS
jgi:hypothetical protein